MEFRTWDQSRVVQLIALGRRQGQPFLPDVLREVVQRYSFQIYPNTIQEMIGENVTLGQGLFDGSSIAELNWYTDGLIVGARADTAYLERFVDDLLDWMGERFGAVDSRTGVRERHFESQVVVSLGDSFSKMIPAWQEIGETLKEAQGGYGLKTPNFYAHGFVVQVDPAEVGGRRPFPFSIQRRVNVPFEANVFYSAVPLRSSDHLALLERLDATAS